MGKFITTATYSTYLTLLGLLYNTCVFVAHMHRGGLTDMTCSKTPVTDRESEALTEADADCGGRSAEWGWESSSLRALESRELGKGKVNFVRGECFSGFES